MEVPGISFPAAEFRAGVLLAMTMGTPGQVEDRLTFRWAPLNTFTAVDDAGQPFDWTETPVTETDIAALQLTVAVQKGIFSATEQALGQFEDTHITVVILDDQWAQLMAHSGDRLPDDVAYNQQRYVLESNKPEVLGLFDVDVRLLVFIRSEVS